MKSTLGVQKGFKGSRASKVDQFRGLVEGPICMVRDLYYFSHHRPKENNLPVLRSRKIFHSNITK